MTPEEQNLDMLVAELDRENRLLRARNERLEKEAEQPAQRTWVGLTDEERDHIWHTVGNSDAHGDVDGWSGRDVINVIESVINAIEAKLREKNQ